MVSFMIIEPLLGWFKVFLVVVLIWMIATAVSHRKDKEPWTQRTARFRTAAWAGIVILLGFSSTF